MDDRLIAQVNATAKSLREAAKAADKELSDAQEERKAIDARIEQLEALRAQLGSAIDEAEGTASGGRRGSSSSRAPAKKAARRKSTRKKATAKKRAAKKSSGRRRSSGNGAGRSDAVVRVLRSANEPMRPAQVAEKMRAEGREDTSSQVSATLSHLARTGKVDKVGEGIYVSGRIGGASS
jgi:chromosome segregation ATPase